jgi:hypothetical protein
LYRSEVAAVRKTPSLPPDNMRIHYDYDPMPADLMPPVGPNLLVHFFETPSCSSSISPDLYRRIPKKLREKLTPCPQKGMSVGWGLQFAEGIDEISFFLFGCATFLSCLFVSIIWAVTKNDVQGGFGIGGFLLAFVGFCGSLLHSWLDN